MLTHAARHIKEGFGHLSAYLNKTLISESSKTMDKTEESPSKGEPDISHQHASELDGLFGKKEKE